MRWRRENQKEIMQFHIDRISCSSLCRARQPLETALEAAARLGFGWVDLSALSWAEHISPAALRDDFDAASRRIQDALSRHGLRVSSFTYEGIDFLPYPDYREAFRPILRLAQVIDVPLINLKAPRRGYSLINAVEQLRELSEMARYDGVLVSLETNCGAVTENPREALWLVKQVTGLGITLCPGNLYAGMNQGEPFAYLYPYVHNVRLRARGTDCYHNQLPWGEGPIDFEQIINGLAGADYRGFYVVEYIEGHNEVDPLAESEACLAWVRNLV